MSVSDKSKRGIIGEAAYGDGRPREDLDLLPFVYRKTDDIDFKAFGKRVKKIRKDLGLTLDKFAESLHVSFNGLSKMERGVLVPNGRVLVLMHEVYGVDITWLLFGHHTKYMDILSAVSVLPEEQKFDLFTRLYSHFFSNVNDMCYAIPGQRTAAGVTHFAKWQEDYLYHPLESDDIKDDEVTFLKTNNIKSKEELQSILANLNAYDIDHLERLLKESKRSSVDIDE